MGIFSKLNKLESGSKEQIGHSVSATLEIGDFDVLSVAKKKIEVKLYGKSLMSFIILWN